MVDLLEWRKNHTVIDQLKELLREAESGRVIGLIAAAHYADGDTAYVGSGSMCDNPMIGVAATQQLAKKLLT